MRKRVKRIPKYSNGGTGIVIPDAPIDKEKLWSVADNMDKQLNTLNPYQTEMSWADMNSKQKTGSVLGAAGTAINLAANSIGKPVTAAGVANGALQGAAAGAAIGGPYGAAIGAVGGGLLSSIGTGGSVDYNTGEVTMPSGIAGMFGHSKGYLMHKGNMVRNSILSRQQTENLKADYMNQYGGAVKVAEGGIVPGEHYASRGEVEVAADGTNAVRYKWDPKGKDTYRVMFNPDGTPTVGNMIFTEEGVKRPNGEKYSDAAEKIINGTKEGSKLRQIVLRKLANEMEEQKMNKGIQKIKKGIPAHEKGLNPYSYNKNLEEFAYWDKDKNEYKKEYLDWVNNLTEQDVRDIEAEKYGDMSEYFSKNKGKKLDVATAQKLMTDKKYGNWHKIGQAFVDAKRANAKPLLPNLYDFGERHYLRGTLDKPITKLADAASITPTTLAKTKITAPSVTKTALVKEKGESNWLDEMSNLLPVIGGLFDKYDWHTESSQITPPKFVPVNADPRPLLRAADESSSIGNYNLANMGVGTGAYMAHSAQLASDRAKRYADAHQWQQETNNKLIAQNAGIYNDWRKQRDAYATQAIADTRANEGVAQQMRDQARKDRLEFYYGKRNDDMLTAMLKPMFEYGTPDKAYRQIYKRRIV